MGWDCWTRRNRRAWGSILGNALLPPPPPPYPPLNALTTGLPPATATTPRRPLGNAFLQPETKRKVYFAFDFDDLMRVNNVRNNFAMRG